VNWRFVVLVVAVALALFYVQIKTDQDPLWQGIQTQQQSDRRN